MKGKGCTTFKAILNTVKLSWKKSSSESFFLNKEQHKIRSKERRWCLCLVMTFPQTCLKSKQTEWSVISHPKFLSQIFWKNQTCNKTLSFGQLHYMLTREKTRREANKKIMGMERKKTQNVSNQRGRTRVCFFPFGSGDGNIIQNSLDGSSQGSALVPDKTTKVTDYITSTNAITSEGWPNIDSTLARAHNFSSLLANFNVTKFCT